MKTAVPCIPGALLSLVLSTQLQAATVTLTPAADTTLFESNPLNNMGAVQSLAAGLTGIDMIARALIQFDVAGNLPAGAIVTAAEIRLTVVRVPTGGGEDSTFSLHRLLQAWGEGNKGLGTSTASGAPASSGEANWLARFHPTALWQSPGGEAGTDYTAAPSGSVAISGTGAYVISSSPSLLADIEEWRANAANNFGWLLRSEDEATSTTARRFGAKEDAANAPRLTITYTTPPRIQSATVAGGKFQLSFEAEAGTSYFVERRSDVATGAWTIVTNVPMQAAPTLITVTEPLEPGSQFYRLGTP